MIIPGRKAGPETIVAQGARPMVNAARCRPLTVQPRSINAAGSSPNPKAEQNTVI